MAAVLRAGYTCVNVNPLYTARELAHQLKDSGASTIVILENFAGTLAEVIERTPVKNVAIISMGDLPRLLVRPLDHFCGSSSRQNGSRIQAPTERRSHDWFAAARH